MQKKKMGFNGMNFREKAIELYKQGKDIETIEKQIGFRLESKMIEKWIEEEEQLEEKTKLIKQSIKIKKQLKKRDILSEDQIADLNENHLHILNKIIELDPENSIAKFDYFRTLYNLKMWEEAKIVGEKIVEKEDNIPVLNSLVNISCSEKEYEKAISYMNRIIELQPENEKFKNKLQGIIKTVQTVRKVQTHGNPKEKINENMIELIKSQIFETNDQEERIKLWKQLEQEIRVRLSQNPENVALQGELMRALTYLGKFKESRSIGNNLLKEDVNNVFALYEMARIEEKDNNLEQEKKYLEKILEISSDEQQQVVVMKLGKIDRILQKDKQLEYQKEIEQKVYEDSIEGKQEKFAKEQIEKENIYTEEAQEEYINKLSKEFIKGNIGKEDLKLIWEQIQQYPDKTKSVIFMVDLYSKITEYYIIPLKALEVYIEKTYTLTPKEYDEIMKEITRYRNCIKLQKEEQEEELEK